ncbi:MAG: hypothetical protein OEV37_03175, partial [Candidatus Berkelbacteria bacterium]|nr:hypothetical protein [Candidatus Berkelbacteria bacterium]
AAEAVSRTALATIAVARAAITGTTVTCATGSIAARGTAARRPVVPATEARRLAKVEVRRAGVREPAAEPRVAVENVSAV